MGLRDMYGNPPRRRPVEQQVLSRRSLLRIPRSDAAVADIDFASAERRVLAGWDSQPHTELQRALEPAAELLVSLAGVEQGHEVLDACSGDGGLALSAARAGARVHACDVSANMVALGRERMRAEREVIVEEADVQRLPYADESFDAVLSGFGAAYAPRALRAARELVRVTRPGGVVGLSAWVPRGLPGRLDDVVSDVAPLPDGIPWPSAWGREEVARRRLEPLLEGLECRTRTLMMSWESPDACFTMLAAPYGLDAAAQALVRPGFDRLLASCNDRPPGVELNARYLVAVGRKPGRPTGR